VKLNALKNDIIHEKLFREIMRVFTEEQFSQYAQVYMNTIFRVAFNYLKSHSDADDITQNVLLKFYQTDKTFESDAHIKHWLIRVTINECKQAFLSPWRRVEPIDDYAKTLSFETPEQNELFDLVMKLPTKYRITILLYYYEEYKADEIALLLGIPLSTVKTRLKRAREKLKNTILEVESNV